MHKKIWLFEGDSVTDCNRDRQSNHLGDGYVYLIQQELTDVTCLNRGISGHRVDDLKQRIIEEIKEANPHLLFILIGINDVWHHYMFQTISEAPLFKQSYVSMLEDIKCHYPNLPIMMIEPFAYPIEQIDSSWMPKIINYQEIVKEIALEMNITFVPMQQYLNSELDTYHMRDILPDGVHPSLLGHTLIKKHLLAFMKH